MSLIILYDTSYGPTKSCSKFVTNITDRSLVQSASQMGVLEYLQTEKYVPTQPYTLLLHEAAFKLYSFDIIHSCTRPCTITDINHIIENKLISIRKDHGEMAEKLFLTLDMIYVNGEKSQHVINKFGTLFFRLSFVFLDVQAATTLRLGCSKFMQDCACQIFPASFFTIQFIKKHVGKDSFSLLYIHDAYAKFVQISNGFYKDVQTVNIGADMLKDIYKDNGILDYMYATPEVLDDNLMIKEIVTQSVDFFTQMLAKRLREYVARDQDLILISSLTRNIIFQEQFNKRYNYFINGFIVPFSSSSHLDTRGRQRAPEDLDILTTINMQDSLKEIIR